MALSDKIETPIGLDITQAEPALKKLRAMIEAQLSDIAINIREGKVSLQKPTVTGVQQFEAGGKTYEARAKAAFGSRPEKSIGEGGEVDTAFMLKYAVSIKELREKLAEAFTLDNRRLQEFKRSIKFKPLEVKQTAIREFLEEASSLEKSIQGLLPTEQLSHVQEFIKKSPTFTKSTTSKFLQNLENFQESIASLSPEKQTEAISDYVKRFGDINNELSDRLEKISQTFKRQKFSALRTKIAGLSPEQQAREIENFSKTEGILVDELNALRRSISEQFRKTQLGRIAKKQRKEFKQIEVGIDPDNLPALLSAYQNYVTSGGQFINEANRKISLLKGKLAQREFRQITFGINPDDLPGLLNAYQNYVISGGKFINEANKRIASIKTKMSRKEFQQITLGIDPDNLPALLSAYQNYVKSGGKFINEANQKIINLKGKLAQREFRQITLGIDPDNLPALLSAYQNYVTSGGKFINEANQKILGLEKKIKSKKFTDFKASLLPDMPIVDQIAAWQAFGAANTEFLQRANHEVIKLNKKLNEATKQAKNKKFADWSKDLQLLSPEQQLAELNKYIASLAGSSSVYVRGAKIMRERVRKAVASNEAQAKKEAQIRFRNNAMIAAGAGLGLLGPAGFPLLNIGFAAMSGGVPGAAIAGVATALGQTVQALESFRQSITATAKEVGAIPRSFKLDDNRLKGLDAALGAVSLSSERTGMEERLKLFRRKINEVNDWNTWWSDIVASAKTVKDSIIHNFNDVEDELGAKSPLQIYREQRKRTRENLLPDLESAQRSMMMQMSKPYINLQEDPYQTYLRVQSAAYDPTIQLEAEERRALIKEFQENTKAIKEANRLAKDKAVEDRSVGSSMGMPGAGALSF